MFSYNEYRNIIKLVNSHLPILDFSDITKKNDMICNAKENNFNSIFVENFEDTNLDKKIWNAIKNNTPATSNAPKAS